MIARYLFCVSCEQYTRQQIVFMYVKYSQTKTKCLECNTRLIHSVEIDRKAVTDL